MFTDYKVTVGPDRGSVVVTWPAPIPRDPENRDAAILDRDSLAAVTMIAMLNGMKTGKR